MVGAEVLREPPPHLMHDIQANGAPYKGTPFKEESRAVTRGRPYGGAQGAKAPWAQGRTVYARIKVGIPR